MSTLPAERPPGRALALPTLSGHGRRAVLAGLGLALVPRLARAAVSVGGREMDPGATLVDNLALSAEHTTFVTALRAAGLDAILAGPGPITVLAPTNAAFNSLPPGAVARLLAPEFRAKLTTVLVYHIVPGRLDAAALEQRLAMGGGTTQLQTMGGAMIEARHNGAANIVFVDAEGDLADITTYDAPAANGVIQVIDKVLLPPTRPGTA